MRIMEYRETARSAHRYLLIMICRRLNFRMDPGSSRRQGYPAVAKTMADRWRTGQSPG
jgi:hypothetical protein